MKKQVYIEPSLEITNYTINTNIITKSNGIIDNNTDVEIPDDFFGDGIIY